MNYKLKRFDRLGLPFENGPIHKVNNTLTNASGV